MAKDGRDDPRGGDPNGVPDETGALAEEDGGFATEGGNSELHVVPDEGEDARYAELHDRYLRLAAEFDNYRRRVQGEIAEAGHRAQAALIGKLMDSFDDLERVSLLDPATATVESIVEGVDLVERKLLKVLADAGVEISSPEGELFDPNRMDALMRVPGGTKEQDNRVAQVFQRGVTVKGILVRPSRVSVHTSD